MVDSKHCRKVARVLKKIGFDESCKITDTLQGSIWRAENKNQSLPENKRSVIKVTDIYLHKNAISIIDNKVHKIKEDILLEQSILKYLTEQEQCPKSIVKFQRFFKSNSAYFLVMEDGGASLFTFVNNAHKLRRSKKVILCNWMEVVSIIFEQMVHCLQYIHSQNICHMDISLENFLINDIDIEIEYCGSVRKLSFVTDNIQIKLCDFGLAHLFTKPDCKSSKICGKQNYKSPEVVNKKKRFDAKLNDVWGIGICLFGMITGGSLWTKADMCSSVFKNVINGHLEYVLKKWGILNQMDTDLVDLLQCILQYEQHRIDLNSIQKHPWMNKKGSNYCVKVEQ